MKLALRAKNKFGFLDGSVPRPTQNRVLINQCEHCGAIILSWIMNSVAKGLVKGVVYVESASSIWKDLKQRFDQINGLRIFLIHMDIVTITQGTNDVASYYDPLKGMWDEFDSMVISEKCADYVRLNAANESHQRLLQFLTGFNGNYGRIRSQILLMKPLLDINAAYAMVCSEENQKGLSVVYILAANVSDTNVFYTNNYKENQFGKHPECDNCHMLGHKRDTCYKPIDYQPGHRLHRK